MPALTAYTTGTVYVPVDPVPIPRNRPIDPGPLPVGLEVPPADDRLMISLATPPSRSFERRLAIKTE